MAEKLTGRGEPERRGRRLSNANRIMFAAGELINPVSVPAEPPVQHVPPEHVAPARPEYRAAPDEHDEPPERREEFDLPEEQRRRRTTIRDADGNPLVVEWPPDIPGPEPVDRRRRTGKKKR